MASRTSKLYEGIPWPIRHSLKAIGSDGSTWFWLTRRTQSSSGIVPRGVLFRDEEREMRERIIAADLIEVVIGLGPNLFYNSPMEACIVDKTAPGISREDRQHENREFSIADRAPLQK